MDPRADRSTRAAVKQLVASTTWSRPLAHMIASSPASNIRDYAHTQFVDVDLGKKVARTVASATASTRPSRPPRRPRRARPARLDTTTACGSRWHSARARTTPSAPRDTRSGLLHIKQPNEAMPSLARASTKATEPAHGRPPRATPPGRHRAAWQRSERGGLRGTRTSAGRRAEAIARDRRTGRPGARRTGRTRSTRWTPWPSRRPARQFHVVGLLVEAACEQLPASVSTRSSTRPWFIEQTVAPAIVMQRPKAYLGQRLGDWPRPPRRPARACSAWSPCGGSRQQRLLRASSRGSAWLEYPGGPLGPRPIGIDEAAPCRVGSTGAGGTGGVRCAATAVRARHRRRPRRDEPLRRSPSRCTPTRSRLSAAKAAYFQLRRRRSLCARIVDDSAAGSVAGPGRVPRPHRLHRVRGHAGPFRRPRRLASLIEGEAGR